MRQLVYSPFGHDNLLPIHLWWGKNCAKTWKSTNILSMIAETPTQLFYCKFWETSKRLEENHLISIIEWNRGRLSDSNQCRRDWIFSKQTFKNAVTKDPMTYTNDKSYHLRWRGKSEFIWNLSSWRN